MPFFREGTLPDQRFGLAIDRIKRELSLHGILHVWSETRGRSRADAPRITARRVQGKWMDIELWPEAALAYALEHRTFEISGPA